MGSGSDLKRAWHAWVDTDGVWAVSACTAVCLVMVIAPRALPIILALALTSLLIRHARSLGLFGSWWSSPHTWLIAFYLLHVVGMMWTEDTEFGLFDLQIKLPLLLIPLVGILLPDRGLKARNALLFAAASANALAVVVCSVNACYRFMTGNDPISLEFFSSRFSFILHPSYFAMYLCLSMAAWISSPIHRWVSAWVSFGMLTILGLGVVLCGSKIGWLLLLVILLATLIMNWQDRTLRRTLVIGSVSALLGITTFTFASPYARERIQEAWAAAFSPSVNGQAETSSAVRRLTWSAAWELFQEAPFHGTGTGDIKNELLRIYDERGQDWAMEHRLNAHGQFLQSSACLGIGGAIFLLLALFAPFLSRLDAVAGLFLLICFLNWSVESVLEVQAGVIWTGFFAMVLFPRRSSERP